MSAEMILLIVAVGIGVGIMSALFGVGGGMIMVPFMVIVLNESQHVAEGTSLLVIVPTALAGVISHRKTGYLSLRAFLLLGSGAVVGAVLGARLALLLEGDVLRKLFAVLAIAAGVRFVLQGWRAEHERS